MSNKGQHHCGEGLTTSSVGSQSIGMSTKRRDFLPVLHQTRWKLKMREAVDSSIDLISSKHMANIIDDGNNKATLDMKCRNH